MNNKYILLYFFSYYQNRVCGRRRHSDSRGQPFIEQTAGEERVSDDRAFDATKD